MIISDDAILEAFERHFEEKERWRWKDEKEFNDFLDFLLNYLDSNIQVCSDSFYYKKDECKPYTPDDFDSYLSSLCEALIDYSKGELVPMSYFEEYAMDNTYAKIRGNYYHVELVVGQGSFYTIAKQLSNIETITDYVDYDLMMKGERHPDYKDNVYKVVSSELDGMREHFAIEEGIFISTLEEYIKK